MAEENGSSDVVADLGAMASEIGYAVQFKIAAALIATIPPDFFVAQNSYMKVLYDEGDDDTKVKLASIMEVYSLAIPFSMKYRKVMRTEEQLIRKEMKDAAQKQGKQGQETGQQEKKPEEESPEQPDPPEKAETKDRP